MKKNNLLIVSIAGLVAAQGFVNACTWESEVTTDTFSPGGSNSSSASWSNVFGHSLGATSSSKSTGGSASGGSATAQVQGQCWLGPILNVGSTSASATANVTYNYSERHYWDGPGTPTERQLTFTCTGSGAESVSVSATADSGVSASASATGNASCQSLGDANASMSMQSLDLTASYSSGSTNISGSGGGQVDDNSASVEGSYSDDFTNVGSGSAAGSASYFVVTGRTYNECTNTAYVISKSGAVSASGACGTNRNDSASFNASSNVNCSI